MDIANIGASPSTKPAFDPFNTLAMPADVPSPAAKKGDAVFTVAPMPSSFLPTQEATKPAAATETPVATVSTTPDSAQPFELDFGTGSSFGTTKVSTSTASTPSAATTAVTVSDAARSSAKGTLASIDAKLAQSGYSKPIGNQRDRTDAVNEVAKNLRGDAKAKFLEEIGKLGAPLGLNFGRRELDGGKAQFDKLGAEQQAINRELYEEWKTGKSTTPTAAPVATAKTATPPAPAVTPAEKPASAPIETRPRSQQMIDRLGDLKKNDLAYAIAWARSMLSEGSSRLNSVAVVTHSVPIASEPDVGAMLKKSPTPEEFGKWMKDLADSNK